MTSRPRGAGLRANLLLAERTANAMFDPVTGVMNGRGLLQQMPELRTLDSPLTLATVVLAASQARLGQGRFAARDCEDRALARSLLQYSASSGDTVSWVADGVATVLSAHAWDAEETRGLAARACAGQHRVPSVVLSRGTTADGGALIAENLGRVAALVRNARGLQWPAGPGEHRPSAAGQVSSATDGSVLGSFVGAGLAPCAVARCCLPQVAAMRTYLAPDTLWSETGVAATCLEVSTLTGTKPVLLDATELVAARLAAPAAVDEFLESLPRYVHVGVDAWSLAQLTGLSGAVHAVRESGRTVVLTGYGSGREPLTALDELPVDAVCLDRELEMGGFVSRADRALRWALIEHAKRHEVLALSTLPRQAIVRLNGLSQFPVDVPVDRATARLLDDAWDAGLSPMETALLANSCREPAARHFRWTRYTVAQHWAQRCGGGSR